MLERVLIHIPAFLLLYHANNWEGNIIAICQLSNQLLCELVLKKKFALIRVRINRFDKQVERKNNDRHLKFLFLFLFVWLQRECKNSIEGGFVWSPW